LSIPLQKYFLNTRERLFELNRPDFRFEFDKKIMK
jgi:hypothetical protein